MTTDTTSFPLTYIRLRFTCRAETHLQLGWYRAGGILRGALLNVMRRATCAGDPRDPAHLAVCPVCWLAAANERPGQERRGYVIAPPLRSGDALSPGERFDFHITLFGEAVRYLPYFVLAVPEAGRVGVGPGRGQFRLLSIAAEHPFMEDFPVLREGDTLVRPPAEPVTHANMLQWAEILAAQTGMNAKPEQRPLVSQRLPLWIDYLTPMRLTLPDRNLLKAPDFGVFFNHLLWRVDELAVQFACGDSRPPDERQRLWDLADRVRLVESRVHWEEVLSGSSRTGKPTWISGMVGSACYSAPPDAWRALLPWLLWGALAQVGKDTSKGDGVYQLRFEE